VPGLESAIHETSVESLDTNGMERTVLSKLDTELDRAAAHFAIFDVFAVAGSQVDAGFEALAAIGALNGHELLQLAAAGAAAHARLEHRLKTVELVDVPILAAGDALGEGLKL
jgi:hypothetical protein